MDRFIKKTIGPRVVGGRYYCGYWGQEYTVTAIEFPKDWRKVAITCDWQDGTTTTHATAWNSKRDRVITS